MAINIDLTFLPANFKSAIIHDIDREYGPHHNLKNHTSLEYHTNKDISLRIDETSNIITLDNDHKRDLHKIERMIKDILIKRRIHEYVVVQDAEEKSKIVILKREHSEQLGIYHCRHCGMEFEDEIQLSTHLRMHYLM
ncbi:MAG: hypothetical protein ACTHKP_16045 [Nitrososphaeraceae archaeon]